jgi:hypothetical protein
MSEHDSTNSGVFWTPHEGQMLSGQGKLNINGAEGRIVVIREPVKRDGEPQLVVYQKIGVLFPNDKKGNDKAPDFSGPLDNVPNHRVAGWAGTKDGRRYMSLKVSRNEPREGGGNGGGGYQDDGWSSAGSKAQGGQQGGGGGGWGRSDMDDEIPF